MSCVKNYCTAFHVSIGSAGELLILIGPLANRLRSTRAVFFVSYPLTYIKIQIVQSIMNTPICFAVYKYILAHKCFYDFYNCIGDY
jgi:hypothetical protein